MSFLPAIEGLSVGLVVLGVALFVGSAIKASVDYSGEDEVHNRTIVAGVIAAVTFLAGCTLAGAVA